MAGSRNALLNNVQLGLGVCGVLSLLGVTIGTALLVTDNCERAQKLVLISGLLLFVFAIATIILKWCPCREEEHSDQTPNPVSAEDPPPAYKRAWEKDFKKRVNMFKGQEINSHLYASNQVTDISSHLEGKVEKKSSDWNVFKFGSSKSKSCKPECISERTEKSMDDDLPAFDVAIKELSVRELEEIYNDLNKRELDEHLRTNTMPSDRIKQDKVHQTKRPHSCSIWMTTKYLSNFVSREQLAPVHNNIKLCSDRTLV